jgi:hypothetical protein
MRITIDVPGDTAPLVHTISETGAATDVAAQDGGEARVGREATFAASLAGSTATDGGEAGGGAVMAIEGLDDTDDRGDDSAEDG